MALSSCTLWLHLIRVRLYPMSSKRLPYVNVHPSHIRTDDECPSSFGRFLERAAGCRLNPLLM